MKQRKRFIYSILAIMVLLSGMYPYARQASAQDSPGGTFGTVLDTRQFELAPDVNYAWYDMDSDRGLQKIHSVVFDPKDPYLKLQAGTTNGKVYGMQGVSGMARDADAPGNRVIAATNADFYDLSTGIPSGIVIKDNGTIMNTPAGGQRAFGVKSDGSAIIGQPRVSVQMSASGRTTTVHHINRARGDNQLILYTPDFYSSTKTSTQGDEVVLEVLGGEVKSGSSLQLRVLETRIGQGDTPLVDGQAVLSASGTARAALQGLTVGDEVEIRFTVEGEWHDVVMAVGGNQLLVQNGNVVLQSDPAYHPRTAVGVKADGSVILLTVDGRSPGFSEGVTLQELGQIMKDMGAVDALNLDGGGSTTFIARLPGDTDRTLLNKPSDGGERSTSNGILLVNTAPEGEAAQQLVVRPNFERVLAGSSITVEAKAVDAYGHPAVLDGSVAWSATPALGTIDSNGVFTAGSTAGFVDITATAGALTGQGQIEVVDTLTELKFPDVVRSVDSGATVQFTVTALRNGQVIQADNDQLEWRVEGPIGTIDADGTFTATTASQQEGAVYVKYGTVEASVAVKVGVPPVILEDFESGLDRYLVTSGAQYRKSIASITTDEEFVRFGKQALKLEYDFTGMTGTSGSYLAVKDVASRVPIPGYPEKISMWVYGDGNAHWLRLQIRDGNGAAVPVDLTQTSPGVDWVGWRYVEGEVPQGRPLPLTIDQIVRYMETKNDNKNAGVIYVDQIRALYGPVDEDITPPTIDRLSPADGSVVTDSTPTIVAYAVDDTFDPNHHTGTTFVDAESIRLYVNGEQVEGYGFYVPEGRLSYTPTEPLPEGINTVKLTLKDTAGNRAEAEWSFYVDSGSPKFVYSTPEQVYAGNTYAVDVSFIQPEKIRGGTIAFGFDSSKIENVQVIRGGKLTEANLQSAVDSAAGTVSLAFTGLDSLSLTEEDLLAQIQYTVQKDAEGTNTIGFKTAEMEFVNGSTSGFIGLPMESAIAHHLRLSWNEDGVAQGFATTLTVTDENGSPVEGAEIVTAGGNVIGTTDAEGKLTTNALTETVTELRIQAVKGNQYSPMLTFAVLPHAGTPAPYNISVTMGQDPSTSRGFTWHTDPLTTGTVVQVVKEAEFAGFDQANVQTVTGSSSLFNTLDIGTIRVHKATVTGLEPGTKYVYRAGDGEGNFSAQGSFATAAASGDELKFLFIGDSQASNAAGFALWGDTLRKGLSDHPDAEFVIHAGDMVDKGYSEAEWNMWFAAAQQELMNTSLVTVVGNHEVMGTKGNGDFLAHFNQPDNGIDSLKGTQFSFDYKDVHFVVLNSEYDYEEQADWLADDLANTDKKWKIAVFHRGPYGSYYDTEIVRELWTPIFDQYGVDLVLSGHDHLYLRTFPMNGGSATQEGEGTVYVVGGSSGPKFYGKTDRPWTEVIFDEMTQIYSAIEIDGDMLKLTAKTVTDGRFVDEFVIMKGEDVPDITLSRIELSGVSASMLAGSTAQATVEAVYSDGSRAAVSEGVIFSSTDESVAKVSSTGVITALSKGSAIITAQYQGMQATQAIQVTPFMTLIEGFENTDLILKHQVNATSEHSIVQRPETIYHGDGALKLSYNFVGQPATSAAYARLVDPVTGQVGRVLEGMPRAIGLWVHNDGGGSNWLRAELQDVNGTKSVVDFTSTTGLNWNGWRFVTASVPTNLVAPIQINFVYFAKISEPKAAGTVYFDQLSAFYTTQTVYGMDLAGLNPMQTGEQRQVKAFVTRENSTVPTEVTTGVTYTSDNEAVVTIGANGRITAVGAGTANISAYYNGIRMVYQPVIVTDEAPVPTGLQYSAVSSVEVGETAQIRLYADYGLANDPFYIVEGATYTSSNTSVATVNGSGLITSVASGTTEISMEYKGITRTFTFTVRQPVPVLQSIEITALPALMVGESGQVKVYGTYTHTPNPVELKEGITFTSSRPGVAAVDGTGNIQALSLGATTIRATFEGKTSSFQLPVITNRDVPKSEMRAAWIATVDNIDWPKKGVTDPEQQKADFIALLDELQANGINAAIVQIKPTADAFYPSELAPWSEWLTGEQGKDPGYNPLAFMIEEVHKRNMEFHAWFNPYRISLFDDIDNLVEDHPARDIGIISYGGRLYFDPGDPAAQQYIIDGIMEVVENYDIDAVHFDDYFYPYPVTGVDFPDDATYQQYKGDFTNKGDWRRNNVNTFLENVSQAIKAEKSYVKFGISPFGIWRNKSVDPRGSDTSGLNSYDAIYADSLGWINNPNIKLDYLTPQIYWNFGYSAAAYEVLAQWWSDAVAGHEIHLYSGNGFYRVGSSTEWLNPAELPNQVLFNRSFDEIKGQFFYSAQYFGQNPLGVADLLKNDLFRYPALVPSMPWIDNAAPSAPDVESAFFTDDGVALTWQDAGIDSDVTYYVVYRFDGDTAGSLDDARNILTTVRKNGSSETQMYVDRTAVRGQTYTYVVTAVDRIHNESAASNAVTSSEPVVEPVIVGIELSGLSEVMTVGSEALAVTEALYDDESRAPIVDGVTYSSSSESVATVDPSGLVKAVGVGTAVIIAQYEGFTASVTVEVVFDGDAEAPIWPAGSTVTASDISTDRAKLTWSLAEDNVGVTAYRIFLDGAPVDTVSAAVYSYELTGLTAGTVYNVKIEAGDAEGNWSEDGPSVMFTTAIPQPAATVTLTASSTVLSTLEELVLSVVVTGTDGTPSGTVTFYADSRSLGTYDLVNGAVQIETTSLQSGVYNITAQYSGDALYPGVGSDAVTVEFVAAQPGPVMNYSLAESYATTPRGVVYVDGFTLTLTPPAGVTDVQTVYRLNGEGDWLAYTGPFKFGFDVFMIEYQSTDSLGNAGPVVVLDFTEGVIDELLG